MLTPLGVKCVSRLDDTWNSSRSSCVSRVSCYKHGPPKTESPLPLCFTRSSKAKIANQKLQIKNLKSQRDYRHRMFRQSHDKATPAARCSVPNENRVGSREIVRSDERWSSDGFYLCPGSWYRPMHINGCRQGAGRARIHRLDEDLFDISRAAHYCIEVRDVPPLPACVE